MKTGVGLSRKAEAKDAASLALKEAVSKAGGANLLLVFSSVKYNQEEVIETINNEKPEGALVAGCSDSGEIINGEDLACSESVAVMAINSEDMKISSAIGHGAKEDSYKAGKEMAEKLKEKSTDPSLIILFNEGLAENGAAIVRGVQDVFGEDFPIVGGSAGDDFKFEKTYQYHNGEVLNGAVVGLAVSGEFSFGLGVRHGWEPVGVPMTVNKVEGAVLKEVDNKPALNIYEEHFGKKAEDLIDQPLAQLAYTYPLGMTVEGTDEFLIRDAVVANKEGEITVAAEIPEGSEIRIMLGDREKAVIAAREAATEARESLGKEPKAAIIFNCMARNKLLGMDKNLEIEALKSVIGEDTPFIGFYTYGEVGPLFKNKKSVFHNETIALLLLGE